MGSAEKRKEVVRLMKSRAGCNSYTQGENRVYFFGKPEGAEKGYSDCSSSVRACLLRAAGIDIGGNTSAQWANAKAGKHGAVIVDKPAGNYFDESKLLQGDVLYFKGNSAHVDSVGHVEMYTSKNECYGHGSGTGPTKKNLKTYCGSTRTGSKKALGAVRWLPEVAKVYKLGDRPLVKGMVAPDVGELQTLLRKLEYDLGTSGIDDDYGTLTARAVQCEQVCAGLAQTGNADVLTIQHIIAHANGTPKPTGTQKVKIVGGQCNIRTGPGTHYKSVGTAKPDQVYVAGKRAAEGWNSIMIDGVELWVSEKYSEIVK